METLLTNVREIAVSAWNAVDHTWSSIHRHSIFRMTKVLSDSIFEARMNVDFLEDSFDVFRSYFYVGNGNKCYRRIIQLSGVIVRFEHLFKTLVFLINTGWRWRMRWFLRQQISGWMIAVKIQKLVGVCWFPIFGILFALRHLPPLLTY